MDKDLDRDLPLKKQISENIERLRKIHNWTLVELSEKSGISKSTLSDYKNCKTLISPGNVEKLSEAFNVPKYEIDPSFLPKSDLESLAETYISVRNMEAERIKEHGYFSVPIVGTISCGNGVIAYEDIEGHVDAPYDWIRGGDYFFLRAKGDSMINARINDGDLLLIRRQETFENGEIIAVLINDEAVLKRAYRTDGALFLQSENTNYDPIILNNTSDIKIIGKLKMNFIEY